MFRVCVRLRVRGCVCGSWDFPDPRSDIPRSKRAYGHTDGRTDGRNERPKESQKRATETRPKPQVRRQIDKISLIGGIVLLLAQPNQHKPHERQENGKEPNLRNAHPVRTFSSNREKRGEPNRQRAREGRNSRAVALKRVSLHAWTTQQGGRRLQRLRERVRTRERVRVRFRYRQEGNRQGNQAHA
jgi:hypothetical protein